jgi:hypothetical protein
MVKMRLSLVIQFGTFNITRWSVIMKFSKN